MKEERNGIVGIENMFNIGSTENEYQREEDILPTGKGGKPEKPENEEVVEEIPEQKNPGTKIPLIGGRPAEQVIEEESSASTKKEDIVAPKMNYRSVIDDLSKRGVFPDLKDVEFEMEDGSKIGYGDLNLETEKEACDLIQTIIESQKESMMEGKIDASSVSEFTKKLIQADKSGADVVEILKTYDRTNAPIEKLNVEDKDDQLRIIRHYVNLMGLPKEDADEYYKSIISRGDEYIEAKAIKYKAELDKKMNAIIEERTRQAEEKRRQDAEAFRKFKKDLKQSVQSKYQLNENSIQKVLDFALKSDENNPGVSKAIERARQMLMNPEEAPDLLMFLMNPREFVKQKSNEQVSREKQRMFKMISNTNKNRITAPVDDRGREQVGKKFDEITLD